MNKDHFNKNDNDDDNDNYKHQPLTQSSQKFIPSISSLNFPFELKEDQIAAVNAWINNDCRGTILYSTGTGKTEIAFECAKRLASRFLPKTLSSPVNKFEIPDVDILSKDMEDTFSDQNKVSVTFTKNNIDNDGVTFSFFNILFLVPRISLIDQTINRLITYGIPKEKVAAYFSERKELSEIVVSTYHSVIKNMNLVRRSNMVIFDEVHLIRDTSKSFNRIFDIVVEDPKKAILGLTATLDKKDLKNTTVLTVLPPVIEYNVKNAVKDKRLAKPVVIPMRVSLTEKEVNEYDIFSTKIKNISNKFKRYDANSMTDLLKKGGFVSGMAKAWFSNVRKRKLLLSCAENKLSCAANIISKKFPNEKIMVFSETIESIEKLSHLLKSFGIESKIIDAKVKSKDRQSILNNWGTTFNVLLSIHTLEIGYDVPQVRIEIILATTSNINQIIQRIGRVLRKYDGKNIALIYVIYIPDTKDDNVVDIVLNALEDNVEDKKDTYQSIYRKFFTKSELTPSTKNKDRKQIQDQNNNIAPTLLASEPKSRSKIKEIIPVNYVDKKEQLEKKIQKAYTIIESSIQNKSFLVEPDIKSISSQDNNLTTKTNESKIYKVQSSSNKDKFYEVDLEKKSCTCADFVFRRVKCKHIIATEMMIP